MKNQHTPSPWYLDKEEIYAALESGESDASICTLIHSPDRTDEEEAANLFLMSAAPELLEALIACIEDLREWRQDSCPSIIKGLAAISKARGA